MKSDKMPSHMKTQCKLNKLLHELEEKNLFIHTNSDFPKIALN